MELSLAYTFIGPDGTRAVVGNCDEATADPDFVGYINPDNQITGLDGAEVRENADVLPEQDGGYHGPFYEGRRPVLVHIDLPTYLTPAQTSALERRLKRATRALRGDTILTWTPSDLGVELELKLRRNGKVNTTGRRPKQVQIPMVSADNATRSSAELSAIIVPGAGGPPVGYSSPYVSPYGTEAGVVSQTTIDSLGDEDALPRFVLEGPITNPELVNNTTGQRLKLLITLAAGELLELDTARKRATLEVGGLTSVPSGIVDYPVSRWWHLTPGTNDVRLLASTYSAGAQLSIYWRDAYA